MNRKESAVAYFRALSRYFGVTEECRDIQYFSYDRLFYGRYFNMLSPDYEAKS
jgi:hypothetical protein